VLGGGGAAAAQLSMIQQSQPDYDSQDSKPPVVELHCELAQLQVCSREQPRAYFITGCNTKS
jgi:hypothetical protein